MASAAIATAVMNSDRSEPRPLRVACRVDASPRVGGGHVMRCLTLADRLTAKGSEVAFVAADMPDRLATLIRDHGMRLERIAAASPASGADWDVASWSDDAQARDSAHTAAALGADWDWLIVDHYGLAAAWETPLRNVARRIAVIDDLANRPHDCDLLLDQTHGRIAQDYRPFVRSGTIILTGARYALLRPEFAAARPTALERRRAGGPVDRILISLGMTDVGALTEPAVRAALACTEAALDVVMGSAAPTLDRIRRLREIEPRLSLHVDTPHIAALMTAADISVGAAGSTSWERCCLGLPSVTVILAANQRLIGERLVDAGAIRLAACDAAPIAEALEDLIADAGAREVMAKAAALVCDGDGAARVVAAMHHLKDEEWTA